MRIAILGIFFALTAHAEVRWLTPDFFVEDPGHWESRPAGSTAPAECRERIASLMCLVEPGAIGSERKCLPGGEKYASHFEALYDQYPPEIRRVFCSLRNIFVEKQFVGTAYA